MLAPSLERVDALLADQRARLTAVIAGDAWPEIKSMARRYLAKVEHWQGVRPGARDLALGEMGPNQYGASIDDVCRQSALSEHRVESLQCRKMVG